VRAYHWQILAAGLGTVWLVGLFVWALCRTAKDADARSRLVWGDTPVRPMPSEARGGIVGPIDVRLHSGGLCIICGKAEATREHLSTCDGGEVA